MQEMAVANVVEQRVLKITHSLYITSYQNARVALTLRTIANCCVRRVIVTFTNSKVIQLA